MLLPARAQLAAVARNRRVDGHSLTGTGTRVDDAGELVSEDERSGKRCVSDLALEIPVAIGSTQADGEDTDESLAVPRFGIVLLVKTQVAWPVKADGSHGWP
jgi:hypothetical protein